ATRDYQHGVKLTALPADQFRRAVGTVPLTTFTKTFTKSGNGTATGTTNVNKGSSTGTVVITNTGQKPVTIPSDIILATAGGVQFTTTAESVVTAANGPVPSVPVPVRAVKLGDTGNVASNTITVIPDCSRD